jgi:hypothetical protein
MTVVAERNKFVSIAGEFLNHHMPIEAMRQAGIELAGEVAIAAERARPQHVIDRLFFTGLEELYGRPLPIRLHLGDLPVEPLTGTDYHAVAALTIEAMNEVVAELWRVGTFPQSISKDNTASVLSFAELTSLCEGIPVDATDVGSLVIVHAPVFSPGAIPGTIHVSVGIRLPVMASQAVSLECTVEAEIPLGLNVTAVQMKERVALSTLADGAGGTTATISISAQSAIKPRDLASQTALEMKVAHGL